MVRETALYDILGVAPDASSANLKQAYHALVRTTHPDKVPEADRERASIRFREVQEAYDILRDPESRAQYDELGADGFAGAQGGPGGMDMDDLFAQMFGGGMNMGGGMGGPPGKHPFRQPPKKQDVTHDYPVTLEDLYKGKSTKLKGTRNKLCPHCRGAGLRSHHKPSKCPACDGKGTKTASMMVGPGMYAQQQVECPGCAGTGETIRDKDACRKCKGAKVVDELKVMELFVERGMRDGAKIVLTGQADEVPGAETGDVVITLHEQPHAVFQRLGQDLKASVQVTLAEALAGMARVVLVHLDGRRLKYTTKPGQVLRPGQVLVVKGEGMPLGDRRDGFGDLYMEIEVVFPKDGFLKHASADQLMSLLRQEPIRAAGLDSDSTTTKARSDETLEDDLDAVEGDLGDFGGEMADWQDESDDGQGEPGVQCPTQ